MTPCSGPQDERGPREYLGQQFKEAAAQQKNVPSVGDPGDEHINQRKLAQPRCGRLIGGGESCSETIGHHGPCRSTPYFGFGTQCPTGDPGEQGEAGDPSLLNAECAYVSEVQQILDRMDMCKSPAKAALLLRELQDSHKKFRKAFPLDAVGFEKALPECEYKTFDDIWQGYIRSFPKAIAEMEKLWNAACEVLFVKYLPFVAFKEGAGLDSQTITRTFRGEYLRDGAKHVREILDLAYELRRLMPNEANIEGAKLAYEMAPSGVITVRATIRYERLKTAAEAFEGMSKTKAAREDPGTSHPARETHCANPHLSKVAAGEEPEKFRPGPASWERARDKALNAGVVCSAQDLKTTIRKAAADKTQHGYLKTALGESLFVKLAEAMQRHYANHSDHAKFTVYGIPVFTPDFDSDSDDIGDVLWRRLCRAVFAAEMKAEVEASIKSADERVLAAEAKFAADLQNRMSEELKQSESHPQLTSGIACFQCHGAQGPQGPYTCAHTDDARRAFNRGARIGRIEKAKQRMTDCMLTDDLEAVYVRHLLQQLDRRLADYESCDPSTTKCSQELETHKTFRQLQQGLKRS